VKAFSEWSRAVDSFICCAFQRKKRAQTVTKSTIYTLETAGTATFGVFIYSGNTQFIDMNNYFL
jgi:hypothetical protein